MMKSFFLAVLCHTLTLLVANAENTEWSFRNHVLPVLSKAGCNTGGCHGALAGKGGFRLSLGAYAPEMDYEQITRDARGRRVNLADPAKSLFLLKPTAAVKHKGGKVLEQGSRDYHVLADWLAKGAPAPTTKDATVQRLEISPEQATLALGDHQSFTVHAYYTDGTVEDVTSWARFTSTNETVATVDKNGQVTIIGHGAGAITAWFSSKIVLGQVVAPYPFAIDDRIYANAPQANPIDGLVLDQLQRLKLKPSPRASDAVFLRRIFLDTIGTLPRPEETRAFLASEEPNKRQTLIDRLLARSEFVDYWSYKWSDMLLVNGNLLRPAAVRAYYQWVREQVEANTPWNDFARAVVTAKGDSFKNGATNFYAVHQDPETMAENISQAFLSLSINCAKCHNHPLEKWTNDQYYAFANLFSRVRAKGWGGEPRSGDGARTLYVRTRGDLIQPRTGKPQPPAPLDAPALAIDDPGDRREVLADWLTSPENPYFTRAIANRVWANFLGVGLVEQVDDLRTSNPASNEPLLAWLAKYLVDQHYDLKALMRVILESETYQRSSETLPENEADTRHYSRYFPKRLMAEVLYDAITDVTKISGDFKEIAFPGGDKEKVDIYSPGTRALQLFDSAVSSYFLKTFGRNARDITCECERSNEPSMVQVLHLANGDTINEKLAAPGSIVDEAIQTNDTPESLIENAFQRCLARPPHQEEAASFKDLLFTSTNADRRQSVEDLYWALLSSKEFLFNH